MTQFSELRLQRFALILTRTHQAYTIGRIGFSAKPAVRILRYGSITLKSAVEDYDAVARQLGRRPRPFRVAARCPFGMPSVVENERKREMPTSFWVTCPSLVAAISRVESTGG